MQYKRGTCSVLARRVEIRKEKHFVTFLLHDNSMTILLFGLMSRNIAVTPIEYLALLNSSTMSPFEHDFRHLFRHHFRHDTACLSNEADAAAEEQQHRGIRGNEASLENVWLS